MGHGGSGHPQERPGATPPRPGTRRLPKAALHPTSVCTQCEGWQACGRPAEGPQAPRWLPRWPPCVPAGSVLLARRVPPPRPALPPPSAGAHPRPVGWCWQPGRGSPALTACTHPCRTPAWSWRWGVSWAACPAGCGFVASAPPPSLTLYGCRQYRRLHTPCAPWWPVAPPPRCRTVPGGHSRPAV